MRLVHESGRPITQIARDHGINADTLQTWMRHDAGPLLGRKLAGKSKREMRDLGLVVEPGSEPSGGESATST